MPAFCPLAAQLFNVFFIDCLLLDQSCSSQTYLKPDWELAINLYTPSVTGKDLAWSSCPENVQSLWAVFFRRSRPSWSYGRHLSYWLVVRKHGKRWDLSKMWYNIWHQLPRDFKSKMAFSRTYRNEHEFSVCCTVKVAALYNKDSKISWDAV